MVDPFFQFFSDYGEIISLASVAILAILFLTRDKEPKNLPSDLEGRVFDLEHAQEVILKSMEAFKVQLDQVGGGREFDNFYFKPIEEMDRPEKIRELYTVEALKKALAGKLGELNDLMKPYLERSNALKQSLNVNTQIATNTVPESRIVKSSEKLI